MVLPEIVEVCDSVELAALNESQRLSVTDLGKLFFPGQDIFETNDNSAPIVRLNEALAHCSRRAAACGGLYPFDVSERSIEARHSAELNPYLFMLLGRGLKLGGPTDAARLLREFERYFEDIVCWAMQRSGFLSQVLSIPREYRNLDKSLVPALRTLSERFAHAGELDASKITSDDNDLDVDVVATPVLGNQQRSGWPSVQIQCATGQLTALQSKLDEGRKTFCAVWKTGFRYSTAIRAGATPDDLLTLDPVHWERLCESGWVLDRTRIVHLASIGISDSTSLPSQVEDFWKTLWTNRASLDWQSTVA